MTDAIQQMLDRYHCQTQDEYVSALREILQQIALLGLWRSKFFEHAAFYGGTALRVLYGLDRYSEDLDFSLLEPDPTFSLSLYGEALQRELSSFGFEVSFELKRKKADSAIESAFLKANTLQHLILIQAGPNLTSQLHPGEVLKIKLEVDTDPPGGFETESRFLLLPVPFAVKAFSLPDLFAGKMHALLCRRWKTRVKGRDWYDLVWYLGHHPRLHLSHLEARMRATDDWSEPASLDRDKLMGLVRAAIAKLDVEQARKEVELFVRDKSLLELWSADFFASIIDKIETI